MYNSYDSLNRLSEQGMQYGYDSTTGTNLYAIKNYGYKSSSNGGTTSLVSSLTYSGNVSLSYTYDYDSLGNITAVYKNGTVIASYVYDNLGQLTRENNKEANKTWVYAYDDRGNITSRKTYAYTVSTLGTVQSTDSYTYFAQWDEAMWNDGLKSYNGSATFTYDAIGNPLTYNNGSTYTFAWQNGRQLASATKGSTTYTYTYNSDGLRTSKTVGSTVYNYYWQGSQLVAMTLENSSGVVTATYKFYYDSNGVPFIFDYNGTIYYYVTNLQGDVVGLADEYGISARYTYDAWGNIIKMDAATNAPYYAMVANPLRYRGYIYDSETGFYYLQSRYYDSEVGRFINGDEVEYLGANGDFQSFNLFAYCDNNPVMRADDGGELWNVIIGAVVGCAFAVISTALTNDNATVIELLVSGICGAISGGFAATGLGGIWGQWQ